MSDRIGEQFGDYQLIKSLGSGSFGDVYLAERLHGQQQGEQVAVKVFKRQSADPEKQIENIAAFIKETNTAFQLKHPNIVRLLDFGVKDNTTLFLVMAYAPNGTVYKKYKQQKLPLETIINYTKQMALALQYAHDNRRIHRDVKPENILLGPNDELWLSDFGLSIVAHDTQSFTAQDGGGTYNYQAPEQNQGHARRASDQYSLGILVYEWMSGSLPFKGNDAAVILQHMETSPPRLYLRVPDISREMEDVVMKALEKNPDRRFDTVQQFADALEKVYIDEQKLHIEESSQQDTPPPIRHVLRANRVPPPPVVPIPRRRVEDIDDEDEFDNAEILDAPVFRVPREPREGFRVNRNEPIPRRRQANGQQVFAGRIDPNAKGVSPRGRAAPLIRTRPMERGQAQMSPQSFLTRAKNFVLEQPLLDYFADLVCLPAAFGWFYSSLTIFWFTAVVVIILILLLTVCRTLKQYEATLGLLAILGCLWAILGGKLVLTTLSLMSLKGVIIEPLHIDGIAGAISFVALLFLHLQSYNIAERHGDRFGQICYLLTTTVVVSAAYGLLLFSWTALWISLVSVCILSCIVLLKVRYFSLLAVIVHGASWSIVGFLLGIWLSPIPVSNSWLPIIFGAGAAIVGIIIYIYKFYDVA